MVARHLKFGMWIYIPQITPLIKERVDQPVYRGLLFFIMKSNKKYHKFDLDVQLRRFQKCEGLGQDAEVWGKMRRFGARCGGLNKIITGVFMQRRFLNFRSIFVNVFHTFVGTIVHYATGHRTNVRPISPGKHRRPTGYVNHIPAFLSPCICISCTLYCHWPVI